jgi:hypothetical protein
MRGFWSVNPSDLISLLVVIAVFLAIAYRISRKSRRWIRGLIFRAEVPGIFATVIALILALQPTLATGKNQGYFIIAACVLGAWFLVAFLRSHYQDEKEEALRFALEAITYSQELYNIIREWQNTKLLVGDSPLDRRVVEAGFRALQAYNGNYRLKLFYFFQDMKRKDIWEDEEAQVLVECMASGSATVENIEELASMLNGISNGIRRYEG